MNIIHHFIVVDDDPMNNLICKHAIRGFNKQAEIQLFTEPEKALTIIKESFEDEVESPETVLFLDINMPSMSGWEFLEEFKNFSEKIRQQISVYVLSSSIDQTDKNKADKNPFVNGYISKPLSVDTMHQIFRQ